MTGVKSFLGFTQRAREIAIVFQFSSGKINFSSRNEPHKINLYLSIILFPQKTTFLFGKNTFRCIRYLLVQNSTKYLLSSGDRVALLSLETSDAFWSFRIGSAHCREGNLHADVQFFNDRLKLLHVEGLPYAHWSVQIDSSEPSCCWDLISSLLPLVSEFTDSEHRNLLNLRHWLRQ